ncbi:MAG TPA: polysaccharide pyruvyl transferase family protein [Candidatus Saccharimonadales bacterium]|nr:polysaccharide pyruvyl transferase family protein [Candidatus Saccharimonadales bacterium]
MSHKKALLLGSYGQTNLGDDLLMYNYVQYLQDAGYDEIYVNISDKKLLPAPIKERFPGLKLFETYNTSILEIIRIIRSVDVVMYGGGTIYKELYSSTGRSPYSVITRMMAFNIIARFFGKQIYGMNIGIGSIKTSVGRMISKIGLGLSTLNVLRDQTSYDYARAVLHLKSSKIRSSTDGLFLNTIWQKPWNKAIIPMPKKTYKHIVGVNLLSDIPDWIDRESYLETMRAFVRQLMDDGNFVLLMPFQYDFNPRNDRVFMQEELVPHLKGYKDYALLDEFTIDKAVSYFQQIDVLVGMRFHSLLLAAVAGTPCLALAYDTKCWRFVTEAKYLYGLKLEDLTLETLNREYTALLANLPAAKKQLLEIAQQNFKEAQACLQEIRL